MKDDKKIEEKKVNEKNKEDCYFFSFTSIKIDWNVFWIGSLIFPLYFYFISDSISLYSNDYIVMIG